MYFRQAVRKLCKGLQNSSASRIKTYNSLPNAGKLIVSSEHDFEGHTWTKHRLEVLKWIFLSGQAAIILGTFSSPSLADVSSESSSKNVTSAADFTGLSKIEEGSMISNEHTSKWRVFTDNGRDYFLKGNIEQAAKFFVSALEEAKKGFGERDPHVASACNNLAELYKVKKDFDKAEPLYLDAINILEEYFGINDIRVGAALHNLGQFYHGQRNLEKARVCYERALKIKRRVLGEAHTEYADTMYHLGTVLYLEGKEKVAEDLIVDSLEILEAAGQGESMSCLRRMQYLAQMYTNSNRFAEAEILLRKTLHIMELSKGWKSFDTVVVAERLALALEAAGSLREAEELLDRCYDAWHNLLPREHIQRAVNMLYIARVKMLISNQQLKTDTSQAITELDKAQNLLQDSVRIARKLLDRFLEKKGNTQPIGVSRKTGRDAHSTAMVLLQSLNALGSLETMKQELLGSKERIAAETAFSQCIATFRELGSENSISDPPQVKAEYLSCLRSLYHLIGNGRTSGTLKVKEIKDEIQRIEGEMSNAATTNPWKRESQDGAPPSTDRLQPNPPRGHGWDTAFRRLNSTFRGLNLPPKPSSRYKLEAMTEFPQTSNSTNVCPKSTYSLLDGYEIERISRQLDYYIKSSHDVNDASGVHGGRRAAVEMKSKDGLKKLKVFKGFWLLGPNGVGCGSSSVDEVVDRRQRRPESGDLAAGRGRASGPDHVCILGHFCYFYNSINHYYCSILACLEN